VVIQPKARASADRRGRRVAVAIAALLLVAQLIATAHVHPGFLIKGLSDGAHGVASEVTCPICVFHAHSPSSAAAVFLLVVPFLSEAFVATARRSRLLCAPKPQLFGRAPPAAA
jgi:hypothetical protein